MRRPLVPRFEASILARFTIWALGVYAIVQGVGVILGGRSRWGGPAFELIRQIADPFTWGLFLAVCGLATLVASLLHIWTLKAVALLGISAWSALFAFGHLHAMTTLQSVGTTAWPVYFYVACSSAILICAEESRALKK